MELKLDFDENEVLAITPHNVELINFCTTVDSSYRNAFSENSYGSTANLIKNCWKTGYTNEKFLETLCKQIDKENSTHLAVSGYEKGAGKEKNGSGLGKMVKKIMGTNEINKRIQNGDCRLIEDLAKAVPPVSKFSFASKFCTYISRHYFGNKDAFAIYDKVVADVLPYYAWRFLKSKPDNYWPAGRKYYLRRWGKYKSSVIEEYIAKQYNYEKYNRLVGDIVEKINEQLKPNTITKQDFDRLLWYYYKGDENLRKKVLEKIEL